MVPSLPKIAEAVHAADLLDEMARVAPPVSAWWKTADGPSRRRLAEILGEIRDIIRSRWSDPPKGG